MGYSPSMHSWPHAPARRSHEGGAIFVTAGTYKKEHLFDGNERLTLLQSALFALAEERGLDLQAWAVFPNHYHLVAHTDEGFDVSRFFKSLHGRTSIALNRLDGAVGRKVWHNFRDTKLTNTNSYLARLHYVHSNAQRHGVVAAARMYPFGSAHWFETQGEEAFVRTVYSFNIDLLEIDDDY